MDWTRIPSDEVIEEAAAALRARNVDATIVDSGVTALALLQELVPEGAEVMTAGSATLEDIGFAPHLRDHPERYRYLKSLITAEEDPDKRSELRRAAVTADYYLGSIHALAQTGEIVVASNTGSQIPAFAYSSPHVILVVGAQKITPDLGTALRRVREHSLPLEDARVRELGWGSSAIRKLLIIEGELSQGRVHVILVKERLGF